jgi:hypothetical protein
MKRFILNIAIAISLIGSAYAQQPPQPPIDAGQAIANQIGQLFMQNAALTEQVQHLQALNGRLQKQLDAAKAPAPAPKPDEAN